MLFWGLISFGCCLLLLPYACKVARAFNYLDYPDSRKQHDKAVPPVGGLILVPVFFILCLLSGLHFFDHLFFFLAVLLVWLTGAIDDKHSLPVSFRLGIQVFSALLLVIGHGTIIYDLGNLFGFGNIQTEPLSTLFSVLCIVLVMNAINMFDGLDELCGGTLAIILMALLCATMISGGHPMVFPIAILLGGIFGFLLYNTRYPGQQTASLFMGDSGSVSLGLILSWIMIELSQGTGATLSPALMAWLLAVPIFDALALFSYRIYEGKKPFHADRNHLHHQILDQGISLKVAVNTIHMMVLISCATGVVTLALFDMNPAYVMPIWLALFLLYILIKFGSFEKLLTKVIQPN